jgi:hypothetical protein
VMGGTTGVLDYLHAEANTRPDAGVEPTELPPGGTDWSAGGEGGLLSDPAMRQFTGTVVDMMLSEALGEAFEGRKPGGLTRVEGQPSASYKVTTEGGKPTISFGKDAPSLGYVPDANAQPSVSTSIWGDIHPSDLPLPPLNSRGNPRTVAQSPGGSVVVSGMGDEAVDVYWYSQGAGHPSQPHIFDVKGAPGSYGAGHAERGALVGSPSANSVTITQNPCGVTCTGAGCQPWIHSEAGLRGPIRVHTPSGSTVYMPDGTQWATIGPLRIRIQ